MKLKKAARIAEMARNNMSLLLVILLSLFGAWMILLFEPLSSGQPYNETVLVNTTVNITNAAPLVERVLLDTPINLIADNNRTVFCNATVFDFDNDTLVVNATFFIENVL